MPGLTPGLILPNGMTLGIEWKFSGARIIAGVTIYYISSVEERRPGFRQYQTTSECRSSTRGRKLKLFFGALKSRSNQEGDTAAKPR